MNQYVFRSIVFTLVILLGAFTGVIIGSVAGIYAQQAPDATVEFSGPPTLPVTNPAKVGTGNVLFTRSGVNPYLHNSVKIGSFKILKEGCIPTGGKNGTTCEESLDVWEVLPISPLGR